MRVEVGLGILALSVWACGGVEEESFGSASSAAAGDPGDPGGDPVDPIDPEPSPLLCTGADLKDTYSAGNAFELLPISASRFESCNQPLTALDRDWFAIPPTSACYVHLIRFVATNSTGLAIKANIPSTVSCLGYSSESAVLSGQTDGRSSFAGTNLACEVRVSTVAGQYGYVSFAQPSAWAPTIYYRVEHTIGNLCHEASTTIPIVPAPPTVGK